MKYMECASAETVIISDDDYEETYYGKIILDISKDQYVHYERTPSIRELSSPENDFSLKLEGYAGTIFLPKNTGIDILTNRDVEGKVASPIAITGKGDVDIQIEKSSNLELILETKGEFFLNSEWQTFVKDIHGWYMHGRDFESLVNRCRKRQEYVIKNQIIDKDILTEYPVEPQTTYIDVCQMYNVAYINKRAGYIYIDYTKPLVKTQDNIGVFRENIKYFNRALNKAIVDERYEKASEIQKKILAQEKCIEYCMKNDPNKINIIKKISKI